MKICTFHRFKKSLVFLSILPIILFAPQAAEAANFAFTIDEGKAANDGQLRVFVEWMKGANKPMSVDLMVSVAKDDSREDIRDKIFNALNGSTKLKADFDLEKDDKLFGSYQIAKGKMKSDDIKLLKAFIENKSNNYVKNISWGGGGSSSIIPGFFDITGTIGDSDDIFGLQLALSSDIDLENVMSFSLPTYDGLTPDEIELGLAKLIDDDPNFSAKVVNDMVMVTGDLNSEFGVHAFNSETTDNLSCACGAMAVPEPSSLLSLLTIGIGGAALTFKRKLKPSKSTEKDTTKVG